MMSTKMYLALSVYDEKTFGIDALGLFTTESDASNYILTAAQDIARAHGIETQDFMVDEGFDKLRDIGWCFFNCEVDAQRAWLDAREVYVVTSYIHQWGDLDSAHVFPSLGEAQEFMQELVEQKLQEHGIEFSESWRLDLSETKFEINISALHFQFD